jgi:hypothetical protein
METIERHVQSFFVQPLQHDVKTLRLEAKRIKPSKEVRSWVKMNFETLVLTI